MARRDFPFKNRQELDRLRQRHPQLLSPPPVPPPAASELFKFTDPNHPSQILDGLFRQWTSGLYLDATVQIGSVNVRAHKCVLSSFSRYFEILFSINMSDSGLEEIKLNDISGDATKLLIQFAYTGTLEISPDNVQDLLCAANFLCIDSAIGACCSYLQNNLSLENCVDILEFALSLDQLKLFQNVDQFIINNFEEFILREHFVKMPINLLIQLLEKDKLVVTENGFLVNQIKQEEQVLKVILRFVEAKPEVHHKHLPLLLLRGVRLLLLPTENIAALKSSSWIIDSAESLKLVEKVLSGDISDEERKHWARPRQLMAVQYEKSRELASTAAVQSELPAKPFDDSALVPHEMYIYITGMKIYTRRWDGQTVVGGIEVFYNTGQSVLHGSDGYENENHEFHLDQDERIISVMARTGWMIDQLAFKTSRGKVFGPYGGSGGAKHHLLSPCDGAYLAYIMGSVEVTYSETAVRRIRFVWGFHKPSTIQE